MNLHEYLVAFLKQFIFIILSEDELWKFEESNNYFDHTNNDKEKLNTLNDNNKYKLNKIFNLIFEILLIMTKRSTRVKKLLLQNSELFKIYYSKKNLTSTLDSLIFEIQMLNEDQTDLYENDRFNSIWK